MQTRRFWVLDTERFAGISAPKKVVGLSQDYTKSLSIENYFMYFYHTISQTIYFRLYMPSVSNTTSFQLKNDFLWLLIVLCLLIFMPSFIPSGLAKDTTIFATLLLAVFISLLSIATTNKTHLYWSTVIAIVAVISNLLPFSSEDVFVFLLRMTSLIGFFSYTAFTILYRISQSDKVSLNLLYGSIAGYLLMGVLGGFWCRLVEFLYPNSFLMPQGMEANIDTMTYYSFVTLTSLGYGDISPLTPQGRSTTIFIVVIGQMYIAINIALLVGSYSKKADN